MVEVDPNEIKDRYPGPLDVPDIFLEKLIKDALTELREYIPNLDVLVESQAISQDSIDKIVSKAVIGAIRNPDGYKSESDGDVSFTRYGDGFVWFRQSDIDRLLGCTPRAAWSWTV